MSFLNHAVTQIRQLASEREEFTSDDLYPLLEVEPDDPNQIGYAFNEAKRLGIISATGRIKRSKRPAAKGRNVQIWQAENALTLL